MLSLMINLIWALPYLILTSKRPVNHYLNLDVANPRFSLLPEVALISFLFPANVGIDYKLGTQY